MRICMLISGLLICRLFPPDLFEKFIDVGHYIRELNAYKALVDKISTLTVSFREPEWHVGASSTHHEVNYSALMGVNYAARK